MGAHARGPLFETYFRFQPPLGCDCYYGRSRCNKWLQRPAPAHARGLCMSGATRIKERVGALMGIRKKERQQRQSGSSEEIARHPARAVPWLSAKALTFHQASADRGKKRAVALPARSVGRPNRLMPRGAASAKRQVQDPSLPHRALKPQFLHLPAAGRLRSKASTPAKIRRRVFSLWEKHKDLRRVRHPKHDEVRRPLCAFKRPAPRTRRSKGAGFFSARWIGGVNREGVFAGLDSAVSAFLPETTKASLLGARGRV